MSSQEATAPSDVLPFADFWHWLQRHPNCILRVGTPDSIIYDHDDHYWSFDVDQDGTAIIQTIRGKRLIAEILLPPTDVAFVNQRALDNDEYAFDMKDGSERVLYYVVLTHPYDEDERPKRHQWN